MDAKIKPNVKVINLKTNKVVLKTHNALSNIGKTRIMLSFKDSSTNRLGSSLFTADPSSYPGGSGILAIDSNSDNLPMATSLVEATSSNSWTFSVKGLYTPDSNTTIYRFELGTFYSTTQKDWTGGDVGKIAEINNQSLSWDANTPYQVVWEFSFSFTDAT